MAKLSIGTGLALFALAAFGYFGATENQPSASEVDLVDSSESAAEESVSMDAEEKKSGPSATALIPVVFGLPLLVCGFLALRESMRKVAMHVAVAVGLLGFLAGAGRGAMGLGKFFAGDPSLNQRSFTFVWIMALLCGFFVFACVQSFRAARRQQLSENQAA